MCGWINERRTKQLDFTLFAVCLVSLSDMWCHIVDESVEDQHYGYMPMICVPPCERMYLLFFNNPVSIQYFECLESEISISL